MANRRRNINKDQEVGIPKDIEISLVTHRWAPHLVSFDPASILQNADIDDSKPPIIINIPNEFFGVATFFGDLKHQPTRAIISLLIRIASAKKYFNLSKRETVKISDALDIAQNILNGGENKSDKEIRKSHYGELDKSFYIVCETLFSDKTPASKMKDGSPCIIVGYRLWFFCRKGFDYAKIIAQIIDYESKNINYKKTLPENSKIFKPWEYSCNWSSVSGVMCDFAAYANPNLFENVNFTDAEFIENFYATEHLQSHEEEEYDDDDDDYDASVGISTGKKALFEGDISLTKELNSNLLNIISQAKTGDTDAIEMLFNSGPYDLCKLLSPRRSFLKNLPSNVCKEQRSLSSYFNRVGKYLTRELNTCFYYLSATIDSKLLQMHLFPTLPLPPILYRAIQKYDFRSKIPDSILSSEFSDDDDDISSERLIHDENAMHNISPSERMSLGDSPNNGEIFRNLFDDDDVDMQDKDDERSTDSNQLEPLSSIDMRSRQEEYSSNEYKSLIYELNALWLKKYPTSKSLTYKQLIMSNDMAYQYRFSRIDDLKTILNEKNYDEQVKLLHEFRKEICNNRYKNLIYIDDDSGVAKSIREYWREYLSQGRENPELTWGDISLPYENLSIFSNIVASFVGIISDTNINDVRYYAIVTLCIWIACNTLYNESGFLCPHSILAGSGGAGKSYILETVMCMLREGTYDNSSRFTKEGLSGVEPGTTKSDLDLKPTFFHETDGVLASKNSRRSARDSKKTETSERENPIKQILTEKFLNTRSVNVTQENGGERHVRSFPVLIRMGFFGATNEPGRIGDDALDTRIYTQFLRIPSEAVNNLYKKQSLEFNSQNKEEYKNDFVKTFHQLQSINFMIEDFIKAGGMPDVSTNLHDNFVRDIFLYLKNKYPFVKNSTDRSLSMLKNQCRTWTILNGIICLFFTDRMKEYYEYKKKKLSHEMFMDVSPLIVEIPLEVTCFFLEYFKYMWIPVHLHSAVYSIATSTTNYPKTSGVQFKRKTVTDENTGNINYNQIAFDTRYIEFRLEVSLAEISNMASSPSTDSDNTDIDPPHGEGIKEIIELLKSKNMPLNYFKKGDTGEFVVDTSKAPKVGPVISISIDPINNKSRNFAIALSYLKLNNLNEIMKEAILEVAPKYLRGATSGEKEVQFCIASNYKKKPHTQNTNKDEMRTYFSHLETLTIKLESMEEKHKRYESESANQISVSAVAFHNISRYKKRNGDSSNNVFKDLALVEEFSRQNKSILIEDPERYYFLLAIFKNKIYLEDEVISRLVVPQDRTTLVLGQKNKKKIKKFYPEDYLDNVDLNSPKSGYIPEVSRNFDNMKRSLCQAECERIQTRKHKRRKIHKKPTPM